MCLAIKKVHIQERRISRNNFFYRFCGVVARGGNLFNEGGIAVHLQRDLAIRRAGAGNSFSLFSPTSWAYSSGLRGRYTTATARQNR
jgi:hypothetical protein